MPRPMKFSKDKYKFGLGKSIEVQFDCLGFDKEKRMAVVGCKNNAYNKKIYDPDCFTLGELKSIAKAFNTTVSDLLNSEKFIAKRVF